MKSPIFKLVPSKHSEHYIFLTNIDNSSYYLNIFNDTFSSEAYIDRVDNFGSRFLLLKVIEQNDIFMIENSGEREYIDAYREAADVAKKYLVLL